MLCFVFLSHLRKPGVRILSLSINDCLFIFGQVTAMTSRRLLIELPPNLSEAFAFHFSIFISHEADHAKEHPALHTDT
ncbi:hypothetical protein DM793_19710 [Paenarthrobacter nitroguajacolicus]|nr:hypothetical protein [Paenarthrobacter nitroguajacolicus]